MCPGRHKHRLWNLLESNELSLHQTQGGSFRVLDLTHARSGPTAVKQLADWGADVIAIEEPSDSPDAAAEEIANRRGSDRLNLHRNKRAITLNLKHEDARDFLPARP